MDKAKLISRGRKLARLADPSLNSNLHEALSAKETLDRFLMKNNLTYRDLGLFTLFNKDIVFDKKQSLWEQQLFLQTCLTFGSQALFYKNGNVRLVGEQSSVEGAERMFKYLHNRVLQSLEKYMEMRPDWTIDNKIATRNSYCIGIVFAICIMLNKIKISKPVHESNDPKPQQPGSSGPSSADQLWEMMGDIDQTNQAIKDEYGDLEKKSNISLEDFTVKDMAAYNAGMYDGQSININLLK